MVGGPVGTFLSPRDAQKAHSTHVPVAAVSDVGRPCGLDGWIATRRRYPPVFVRSKKLEASELSRYMRPNATTREPCR